MLSNSGSKDTFLTHYEVLWSLGEGVFGKVKLARHKLTGTQVALKVIQKTWWVRSESLEREVCIMKALNHPHIIQLFQVLDTKDELILVMEYAEGGDLHDYLRIHGRLEESEARDKFEQILLALSYLHGKRIVHRDLKPENLLLDRHNNMKLADFGLSVQWSNEKISPFCGSPEYAAPESYHLRSHHGPTVDIWSLGVILYHMVTGSLPFVGGNFWKLRRRIISGSFHMPAYLSEKCKDLLRKMLVLDPQSRSKVDELMKHPWVDMHSKLLILREPSPHHHHDPATTKAMITLGFDKDQIYNSVAQRKFDYVMATYLILLLKKEEGQGNWVLGKPSPLAVQDSPPQDHHLQPNVLGQKTVNIKESTIFNFFRRSEKRKRNQILALVHKGQRTTASKPALEPPSTTLRTPTRRGWRFRLRSNAVTAEESSPSEDSSLHAPEPEQSPASSHSDSQSTKGTAKKILKIIVKLCCCCCIPLS
ncbi:Serine/threonine-protein kinase MARK2 [Galemys pyrenaicus]|uniref:non-specific serine/threonine protein kinase n=1 Tax=Galemys pyrenaicus TaxID=202257 RepID=A0A8J6A1W5_GALPY|nr:Serine/threonine-protein kinase MARK2 [Galemys pyrenaicus]